MKRLKTILIILLLGAWPLIVVYLYDFFKEHCDEVGSASDHYWEQLEETGAGK